jgi:hypothetical protein
MRRTAIISRGHSLIQAVLRGASVPALSLVFVLCIFPCLSDSSVGLVAADDSKKDYALIYGTVWSADQRPVAGVPITIRRASDKKPKWELMSDRQGEFAQRVPVGEDDYIVQANIKTPKGKPKPEVTVHIEHNERKDIGIHLNQ